MLSGFWEMLWSPSIIRPSQQNIRFRLLRLFHSCYQTLNTYTNEYIVLLLKRLLVLILPVCWPKKSESIPSNLWISAHTGPCSCMQPSMSWPDSQKPNLPMHTSKYGFLKMQQLQMDNCWCSHSGKYMEYRSLWAFWHHCPYGVMKSPCKYKGCF